MEHETRFEFIESMLSIPRRRLRLLLRITRSSLVIRPHVGKEMPGLTSLRNFARNGHIDAFRSIVGEGRGAQIELPPSLLTRTSSTRIGARVGYRASY